MMDEDPRFPNRDDHTWEQPLTGDKLASEEPQPIQAAEEENKPLPISSYRVVGAPPAEPGNQPGKAFVSPPIDVSPKPKEPVLASVSASAEERKPAAKAPVSTPPLREVKPPFHEVWIGQIRKFFSSPTRTYIAIGTGLGLLLIVVVAIAAWLTSPPVGRYDMESVTSDAAGLKGHLYVQWDKKLEYRLTIEPSDPNLQEEFSLAATQPRRPLSVEIHLQDVEGFVLCSKEILLKYDARNAADLDASALSAQDAQEAAREKGRDIFQNQVGANGQVVAINAQGGIPCSAKAYKKAENWSFTPNFPSLAEQAEWLKSQPVPEAGGGHAASSRRRAASKAPVKLVPFSVEGDDAIVEFDAARGVIETRGRKTFFVAKTSGAAANSGWQDYPVNIHFRCDRSLSCILMSPGLGDLHAKMK
jgi:hypothetical protein